MTAPTERDFRDLRDALTTHEADGGEQKGVHDALARVVDLVFDRVVEATAAVTASPRDFVLANGTFTVSLLENQPPGTTVLIKNTGTGTITVSRSGSDTIDGATSKTMSTQYEMLGFVSDGKNWWIW